jgi:MFS family permease
MMLQIHSFVAVGELAAPPLGGFLYDRGGYGGVLGISIAVLIMDLLMRLLLIEKKAATAYQSLGPNKHGIPPESNGIQEGTVQTQHQTSTDEAAEYDKLLPANEYDLVIGNNTVRTLPILSCLSNRRLLVSLALGFIQALIIGTYDATLTTEAAAEFEFSSSETGVLFLALSLPNLFLAPLAGWAVDKYGTKAMAVVGFGFFAPSLALLRIPGECDDLNQQQNIGLFCAILALNGVCMSMVSAPSVVEASAVVRLFDKANPGFFGPNGPYGQLFGLTTFVFNAGLTVGSMWSGPLRDSIGYGNMYALVAGLTAVAAALSFKYFGAKDKR